MVPVAEAKLLTEAMAVCSLAMVSLNFLEPEPAWRDFRHQTPDKGIWSDKESTTIHNHRGRAGRAWIIYPYPPIRHVKLKGIEMDIAMHCFGIA